MSPGQQTVSNRISLLEVIPLLEPREHAWLKAAASVMQGAKNTLQAVSVDGAVEPHLDLFQ